MVLYKGEREFNELIITALSVAGWMTSSSISENGWIYGSDSWLE
jgi:hypothetical protein